MQKEKVDEIMNKVVSEWKKRIPDGAKLSQEQIDMLRQCLSMSPHDDGLMRVTSFETGKTHLVPMEEMILYGLRGDKLEKYPLLVENGKT